MIKHEVKKELNKVVLVLDNDTLKYFLEDLNQMKDRTGYQHFKYINYEQAENIINQMYKYKKVKKG